MNQHEHSEILEDILFVVYPLIFLFGFYVILAGNKVPGGGFQGGAILVAVFMSRYLVFPLTPENLHTLRKIDKIVLIVLIAVAFIYIIVGLYHMPDLMKIIYNNTMGVLIGIKVSSGLTVIFYTFVDIEGGEKD